MVRDATNSFWMINESHNFGRNLDDIDFGPTKNDTMNKIFLVSLNKLVAQYSTKLADIKSTLLFKETSLP